MRELSLIDTPKGPMTRKEAAEAFGITLNTLIGRLWRGVPYEKLFLKTGGRRGGPVKHWCVVDGKKMTLKEACERNAADYTSARRRKKRGIPDDRLFERNWKPRYGEIVTPWGVMKLTHLAEQIGMSFVGLKTRLDKWSREEALNTPPFGIRGKHFIMPPEEFARLMKKYDDATNKNKT